MYVWNHIDNIDPEMVQEIKDYYKNNYNLQKEVQKIIYEQDNGFLKLKIEDIFEKCPKFTYWCEDVARISIDYVGYLISAPFYTLEHCHIDTDTTGIGINFPVSGCDATETIFYEPNSDVRSVMLDAHKDKTRIVCYSDKWVQLTKYALHTPTICINTIPHVFTNTGEGLRISMTVRCTPDTVPFHLMRGWDTSKDAIRWGSDWYESWYGHPPIPEEE